MSFELIWHKDDEGFCFSCNEKIDINEDGQCETCFDKGIVQCMSCSNCGDNEDYHDMEDGDYHCEECYKPTCQYCNEYVDEEGDFCCDDCIKGFKYDMREK